jgi:hypothetical protein
MRNLIFLIYLISSTFNSYGQFFIVKDSKATVVFLIPEKLSKEQRTAIDDFKNTVYKASNTQIKEYKESDEYQVPKGLKKIIIGPSALSQKVLSKSVELKPEEYKIIPQEEYLIILAKDIIRPEYVLSSRVTAWAFSHIMEHYMGVKWLYPGDLGTVVPKTKNISIPNQEISFQPILQKRRLYYQSDNNTLMQWAAHHQVAGERLFYKFSHSFRDNQSNGNWWKDFIDKKPYLLAQSPNGKPMLYGKEDRYKVCTSHPETTEEVLRRWESAGKPDYWDITPNDGNGFCTCDKCMQTDSLYGDGQYSKQEVWDGLDHVNLTGRHVHFWNEVIARMREKNPKAVIGVFLYSKYRDAPKRIRVHPGVWGEIVHGYDFTYWQKWKEAGVDKIGLRPNWWHMGGNGPHLPLHTAGAYIEKARKNDMMHIFMDMLVEYWATQGPYYYTVARLQHRYDLNTDQIIQEYCDAYGKASPVIKEYIDFWEEYMKKVAYNIPAGGRLSVDSTGIYETQSRKYFGEALHPLQGHYKNLPYVYTAEKLAQGDAILLKALKKVNAKSDEAKRIEFLREGLRHVELLKSFIQIDSKNKKAKTESFAKVEAFDKEMVKKYGYWGSHEKLILGLWKLLEGVETKVDDM